MKRLIDEAYFERVCQAYRPYFRRISGRILRGDGVDDVLQDAFILAWTKRHTFSGASTVETWMGSIVKNASLMELRRRRGRAQVSIEGMTLRNPSCLEAVVLHRRTIDYVLRALPKLSASNREMIEKMLEDYTHGGQPYRMRRFKALQELRKTIQQG